MSGRRPSLSSAEALLRQTLVFVGHRGERTTPLLHVMGDVSANAPLDAAGTLPSLYTSLSSLSALRLGSNALTGLLPGSYAALRSLEVRSARAEGWGPREEIGSSGTPALGSHVPLLKWHSGDFVCHDCACTVLADEPRGNNVCAVGGGRVLGDQDGAGCGHSGACRRAPRRCEGLIITMDRPKARLAGGNARHDMQLMPAVCLSVAYRDRCWTSLTTI
jgi:hypothetical protein